jgi:hypothetical protein
MSQSDFSATATIVVRAFDTTARGAIEACRLGGARLGDLAAQQWERAFEQARPRLSPETRRNATRTRKAVARYYRQGLSVSTTGAEAVVETLVQAAGLAIERAEGLRNRSSRA